MAWTAQAQRSSKMAQTAVGHFRDHGSADAAYEDLIASGFSQEEISLIGRGSEQGERANNDGLITTQDGVKFGGIAGLLLGAAVMLIPSLRPIVAAGPIAAGLAGLATGGVTGAVLGGVTAGLIHAGLSEDDATYYDERLRDGGYLLTVHTEAAGYDQAHAILVQHGAETRAETSTAATDHSPSAPARDDLSRFDSAKLTASDRRS
jgi:hypothetical protein